ncbi:pectinesterase family protein [Gorillibacterium sp. sgz5001074]|uniref:pectinesterase family protein n=1 Tax=Gorillibacterium sp. sgz5001074 TaxID=3446695 RepID=UPI003F67B673
MITVAKDGSGEYSTLQAAIDSIPEEHTGGTTIYIKKGVYEEKIHIRRNRVHLIGEDRDHTILTYGDYAKKQFPNGESYNTFNSYSFFVSGDDFTVENLTLVNSSGSGDVVGQALAAYVDADRVVFRNCRLLAHQDTLFTGPLPPKPVERATFGGPKDGDELKPGRHYYDSCYIAGDVDFIFGSATAVFDRCDIFSKKRDRLEGPESTAAVHGYITAASTPQDVKVGYVFRSCRLIGDAPEASVYLGRPWREYAATAFIECWMGEHIKPEGWHNWGKPEREATTRYCEYRSFGPGAAADKRVSWAPILTEEEARAYDTAKVLAGKDGWNPQAGRMTVYLAGDSTVADYPHEKHPMLGWGARLHSLLEPGIRIVNAATNGRSSKSFIDEGRLDTVLAAIAEGDVLLVQFGHNDSKPDAERRTEAWSTYQEHLLRYIEGARAKGAYPVLISSVARRKFDENGVLQDTHEEYPAAMKQLAEREKVPFVDLSAKSFARMQELGPEKSLAWFTWLRPGENPNYPEGVQDNTHLNETGADTVARLVAEELALLPTPLAKRMKL